MRDDLVVWSGAAVPVRFRIGTQVRVLTSLIIQGRSQKVRRLTKSENSRVRFLDRRVNRVCWPSGKASLGM
jgi:hypothetical protein